MGITITKNTLGNFLLKLENVKNLETFANKLEIAIANEGVDIARSKYSESGVQATVFTDSDNSIVAQGYGIAFIEYGTGTVGIDSKYGGNIPTSGVPITENWEYNYDSGRKFTSKSSGKITWKVPKYVNRPTVYINAGGFTHGEPAQAQMYNTSVELRGKFVVIAKQVYKEE